MRRSRLIPQISLLSALTLTLAVTTPLRAAEPDPAIYLLVDTSGSMLMNIAGTSNTWGDYSSEHSGVNGNTSRFYIAKEAIKSVLNSYGEVRWGMARFEQNSGLNYLCSCSSALPNNTAGCGGYGGLWHVRDDCRLCDMMQDYPDYDDPTAYNDRVCINYAGGILDGCRDPINNAALTGGDILVPLGASNVANILKWINHAETDVGEGYNTGLPPEQQADPELRATGGTPIGGSLQTIYDRLAATDLHADGLRGCRPYSVIVLTDGAESCNTNPISVATSLRSVPDNASSCTNDTNCPPNSWCSVGKCRYDVKTHIIAFAVAPDEYLNCHQIGVAGGTGGAISAQNQAELVAAMAEIIADSIVTELCNGLDDDCDGSADEDFPEKGLACDNGLLGQCRGTGNYVCDADGTSTRCDITSPGLPASGEVCDGLDNDCDGLVDDGITCAGPTPDVCNGLDDDNDPATPDGADDPSVGIACGSSLGICQPGVTICSGGAIICQQDFPPGTETCNNLDDDCDGMTDEGLTSTCDNNNAFGTCSGLSYCSAGNWICTAADAGEETCNNFDDDCDGQTDEDLLRDCEVRNSFGVCGGQETCSAGAWGACSATTPAQDICNGIDDNCDGAFDDDDPNVGLPCSGGCGVYICDNGNLICDGQSGSDEICDGLDNDCDGQIDENLSQDCSITNDFGTCYGVELCLDGGWEGCTANTPRQEECNGVDDNCDGLTDNEAVCPDPNDVCHQGACRERCTSGEFTCKGTEECVVYPEDPEISICMPLLQECGMQICTLTEVCVELECINPCEGDPCGENETCTVNFRWREGDPVESQYFCIDASCATVGNSCPDGEFCWDGDCVTDPCLDMTCSTLEYCTRALQNDAWVGRCEAVCNCPTGQRCDTAGACETDPCYQKDCTGGTVCVEGECVQDSCAEITCRTGEICVDGGCYWNLCYEVECPAWAQCAVVSGDDGPSAVCKPRPENVTEEIIKGQVTAGGFGCSTSRGGGSSDGLFWGLLLAVGLFFSRRPRLRLPTFLPLLLVGVLTLGACDRAVYTIKEDGSINTDVNNTNNTNNTNNINNINNTNNCTPTGDELCDGLDNDCDGVIDDPWVPEADGGQGGFMTDPANCGECNRICAYFHGEGLCEAGDCALGACDSYYFDNNDDASDGCEYRCNTLGGTEEVCDGLDNDCDGISDEPWIAEADGGEGGWLTDPENCGFCGISCNGRYPNAVGACIDGRCTLDACEAGWINANQIVADGCETQCVETNGGVETCDNLDNDCDGFTDEDASDQPLARACYTGTAGTEGVGACMGGTEYCNAGVWGPTCVGEILPRNETCDGADNDCDNTADETFNFQTDINYCGSCTNSCLTNRPDNSYPVGCAAGTCQYACSYGFHDINGDLNTLGMAGDGCEYVCEPSATAGTEFCDGMDNDCDQVIDEVEDLVLPPAGYCRTGGGCGVTVTSTCQLFGGTKQWVCNYPAAVERVAGSPNQVKGYETLCDNLDGDCDGNPDDDFYPAKGSACLDSNVGICQGSGIYACKSDHTGTECSITTPGAPPTVETCDNIDNDCDGLVDEPAWNPGSNASYVQDATVNVSVGGQNVAVYKYEASRPTATAGSPGTGSEVRACSKAGVIPWSRVTFEQAQQACRAAGMDLCEDNVWEEACDGSGTRVYPYSDTYNASTCWGADTGITAAQTTGSKTNCTSNGYLVLDLSGNLREWVKEIVAYSADGKAIYQTRGGSFRDGAEALKCAHDTVALTEDAFSNNVGFRCCTRCGNNVLDADETCDDGNRISGDGCSAVCGPDTCGDGVLQGLEECDCGRNPDALPGGCLAINGAPEANCSLNCTIPEELCSVLYPGDQDRGAESSDCTDSFCDGTRCGDVTDNDGDGFAEPDDCNDANANIHPAMDEVCGNGTDDNCNGDADNAEPDKDGDGVLRCVSGTTTDCDDWDPDRYPGRPEVCNNGVDENCDGSDTTGCATACELAAFERSYLGCEYFAVTTMNDQLDNSFNNNFVLSVFNRNATAATVTITKAGAPIATQSIAANSYYTFYLAYDTTLKNTIGSILNRAGGAYIVTSTQPVAVYQFNPFDFYYGGENSYTNDASLLLPTHVMTNRYMVTSSTTLAALRPGFFAVAATGNGTTISVYYNGNAAGVNKGQTRTYNLNRGDVLQVPSSMSCTYVTHHCSNDYDLTGSTITVTAGPPVAVFAGHNCQNLPDGYGWCDHLEEQMMPLETWGKNFIATITSPYTNVTASSNMFRILASEASTVVTFSPAVLGTQTLNAGQYVNVTTNQNFTISATKPIMVTQYMLGQGYYPGATTGDPAMGILVPTEQFRTSYSFTVPSSITNNFVNIVKPVAQSGKNAPVLYFDGVAIAETNFSQAIGGTYLGVYRRNISASPYTHTITSSQPFGIMVYGHAAYTSYIYPGGLDLNIINIVE